MRRLLTLGLAGILLVVMAGVAAAAGHVHVVVDFDEAAGELPEGIVIDDRGDMYVSLAPLGELRRISPDGTQTTVATIDPGVGFGLVGLAAAPNGDIVAGMVSFTETHGVWRISRDGTARKLRGSEAVVLPNDVAFDRYGNLYITDSILGAVWRIQRNGTTEPWVVDPLLAGDGSFGLGIPVGANGIVVRGSEVIVANSEGASIVSIPILADGSAGAPAAIAAGPAFFGTDGLALDGAGTLYGATGALNTVFRVDPGGVATPVATVADGLDFPATLAFGTRLGDTNNLYATNFAALDTGGTAGPGVVRIALP